MHAALEAIAAACVLIEGGDCERVVVVAVDEVGAVARALLPPGVELCSGAVSLLLTARAEAPNGRRARARVGSITLRRGLPERSAGAAVAAGHRALLPLTGPLDVTELTAVSPPDAFARVVLESV
jgi:hypothetical protein